MLQTPEGQGIVDLRTAQSEIVWSQLIVSSPGVINLVGL